MGIHKIFFAKKKLKMLNIFFVLFGWSSAFSLYWTTAYTTMEPETVMPTFCACFDILPGTTPTVTTEDPTTTTTQVSTMTNPNQVGRIIEKPTSSTSTSSTTTTTTTTTTPTTTTTSKTTTATTTTTTSPAEPEGFIESTIDTLGLFASNIGSKISDTASYISDKASSAMDVFTNFLG